MQTRRLRYYPGGEKGERDVRSPGKPPSPGLADHKPASPTREKAKEADGTLLLPVLGVRAFGPQMGEWDVRLPGIYGRNVRYPGSEGGHLAVGG